MFHDDLQTQVSNDWKRNNNEHPIDRILTTYNQSDNPLKTSSINPRQSKSYKSETKHIIQRQRVIRSFLNRSDDTEPSIRKSTVLPTDSKALSITSIPSPQFLFAEVNEQLPNNNNNRLPLSPIRKELDRQSPVLIRRRRRQPYTENFIPIQQVTDITNLSGNQLTLTMPLQFPLRNRSSRSNFLSERSFSRASDGTSSPSLKPMNYSRANNDVPLKQNVLNAKGIHLFPSHVWIPTLSEQDAGLQRIKSGISRSRSSLSRQIFSRRQSQPSTEQISPTSKIRYFQDLYISPRSTNRPSPTSSSSVEENVNKKRFNFDEWEDPKSSSGGISDDDESMIAAGTASPATSYSDINAQHSTHPSHVDHSKSKVSRISTSRKSSRRRAYNLALPPVAEHVDDEETGMKRILAQISAIENDDIDEEDSLTFQLLNQQETDFEKNFRQLQSKQK